MGGTEPIAIIGMAGRFPRAGDIEEFWANLAAGRDCLTELDDAELLRYNENPEQIKRPDYVRKRPVLADSDAFDARLFGLTPREAELRDPQYRVMLETVHATLEHGGYDPHRYPGKIGLFAGANANRYRYDYIERRREVASTVGFLAIDVANNSDYLCTFISYKLALRGPSLTLLTACSTSLVAVHLACTAIRTGDCDMAIAGGVDIEFPYHRGFVPLEGGILARDGTLRTFDAHATGTNFGDGVGAVLLKPLSAALSDGDTVYATILGTAINNDGNRKVGYTAPSVVGQSECIRQALATAAVSPRDIDLLEAHGTATRVGDPIELAGLIDAYQRVSPEPLPSQYCAIGSVKSNVGHLGQAAGVAALIKTVLALNHRMLPASINMTTPNPGVDWAASPFYVNTELREWPAPADRLRLAGVSSFGIGGTNAHLILQEAPEPSVPGPRPEGEALLWSAMDDEAERALCERLAAYFDTLDPDVFPDAAYTMRVGRAPRPARAAAWAGDAGDAATALRAKSRVMRADGVDREIVFAFPGQGGLHPHACRGLYDDEPLFRAGCDAAFEILNPMLGLDLRALWQECDDAARLADTAVAQPLLYTLEYTLAHCLRHWGVQPALLTGHSLGELVAAAVAGVFDFESGLRAVAARARCMAAMPPGAMLAVESDPDGVGDLLGEDLVLAAVNAPRQVVLSGPVKAIATAADTLAARGLTIRTLATSHAFHSPLMAEAARDFQATLGELALHRPEVPVISAVTGAPVTDEQAVSAEFWSRQLIEPLDYNSATQALLTHGPLSVIEAGPGRTLVGLLRRRPDVRDSQSRLLAAVPHGLDDVRPGRQVLSELLTRLWVDGEPVSYWEDSSDSAYRRVAVPGYPYQRRRYWLDNPAAAKRRPTAGGDKPTQATQQAPAQAGPPVSTATVTDHEAPRASAAPRWHLAEMEWSASERRVNGTTPVTSPPTGAAVLLMPADPVLAGMAQRAVQRAGYRTIPVGDQRADVSRLAVTIDPERTEDWLAILEKAAEATPGPVLVGHAALLGAAAPDGLEAHLSAEVATVLAALRSAAAFQRRRRVPTRVLLLGQGMVDVTGAEPLNPAVAALPALLRSAERELPGLRCQVVDIGDRVAEDLLAEALAEPDSPIVALRGRYRWQPRLRALARAGTGGGLLRSRGTYLITGGLGGLGMVVAQALAETGLGLRLALLGRSGLNGLAEPARASAQQQLDKLVAAGAEVRAYACDVGDVAALAAVTDQVQDAFGPVHGVIHAAGVAGGGLVERRGADDVRRVLHPKVSGVLALETVFTGRPPLDFMVLFSSHAGLAGLYGSADYAAANAFLDAFARLRAAEGRRIVSVQWPGWAEVGMLARSAAPQAVLGGAVGQAAAPPRREPTDEVAGGPAAEDGTAGVAFQTIRTPGRDWEFDEHLFAGKPVLPGTAMLEFAVMAAQAAGIPDGGPLEVRGTAFLAPVVGDQPREVRVLLSPMADVHQFRVQARPAGSSEPWTDHSMGTLGPAEPVKAPPLPELAARMPTRARPQLAGWMTFGPRWATMTEVRGDDTERLARLELPERYHADLEVHPLHPALLDVAAGVLSDVMPGRQYAPFLYRRVLVLAPLTPDITVHTRFASGGRRPRALDFDIYDTHSGALLVRAESFATREVVTDGLAPPTTRSPGSLSGNASDGLLLPSDGAAAFLDLLNTETPPVTLVAAPGAWPSVPGIPWTVPAPVPGAQPTPPAPPPQPAPPAQPLPLPTAGVVPDEDPVTAELRRLWANALGITDIGDDDDFFQLGGDSMTAVQLAAQMSSHFGIEIGAGSLFDASTLTALAEEVRAARGKTG